MAESSSFLTNLSFHPGSVLMRAKAFTSMVALLLVHLAPARVHGQAPGARAPKVSGASTAIVLRNGDGIRVEIKDEKDLSGQFDIGADGQVLLPAIGLVRVSGRPFDEVQAELRAAYGKELVNPVVRISPLLRIAVLGEVRQPGLYLIDETYQVSDVLARAGGLAPSADASKIVVTRLGGDVAARFNSESVHQPLAFRSGDQLHVDRRSWTRENLGVLLGTAGSLAVAIITGMIVR